MDLVTCWRSARHVARTVICFGNGCHQQEVQNGAIQNGFSR